MSSCESPKIVEPEEKDCVRKVTEEDTINCSAVRFPCTVRLPPMVWLAVKKLVALVLATVPSTANDIESVLLPPPIIPSPASNDPVKAEKLMSISS